MALEEKTSSGPQWALYKTTPNIPADKTQPTSAKTGLLVCKSIQAGAHVILAERPVCHHCRTALCEKGYGWKVSVKDKKQILIILTILQFNFNDLLTLHRMYVMYWFTGD